MRALSLQGGGVLGCGQVVILQQLEFTTGKQIYQLFDLIAGTSVGSIIGSCLSVGIPAAQILTFFTQDAPIIFKHNWINDISQLTGPKYSASALESSLQGLLKDLTLKDCKNKFVATSYDWATDRPVYFKSYEKSSSTKNYIIIGYDDPIQLWQVARASSAAQSYFRSFEYNGLVLMDGGNGGFDNPDMLAFTESVQFSLISDLKILSIGTGDTIWGENPQSMVNPSLIEVGINTIKILFSAGESSEVYMASRILGNNYYRVSPDLGNGFAIDDASTPTLNALQLAANKCIQLNLSDLIKSVS